MANWREFVRMALPVGVSLLFLAVPPQGLSAEVVGAQTAATDAARSDAEEGGVEGIATYYAKRWEGRRTTSGERYRSEKMTAAHARLPLGSKVRVRNMKNGREVVVEVNDRCRKRRVEFIDLSRAAARKLGFLGAGRVRVRIERLGPAREGGTVALRPALPRPLE